MDKGEVAECESPSNLLDASREPPSLFKNLVLNDKSAAAAAGLSSSRPASDLTKFFS